MTSIFPASWTSLRNCILEKNLFVKVRLPLLYQNENVSHRTKEPYSVCGFLFTVPGLFTLIEQALEALNAHQSCAFYCCYH